MQINSKRLFIWAGIVALLLLIPLIAMQFTSEVNWDFTDFAIMGAILFGLGFAYELIASRSANTVYRTAFGVGLLGAFLLFWVNAAVGIIGNEGQTANLLYVAVFVVGLVGALISRFKARGMAYTLFTAAAIQMLVPATAYFIWPPPVTSWSPNVFGVFLMSGFFAILFMVSGVLFQKAADSSREIPQ
ncbi:MAG: hypothetical protein OEQ81_04700 [Flavobacteriaceae bacterium]|nr:hypothetical protein [Flavobacteriaceae bacterium]